MSDDPDPTDGNLGDAQWQPDAALPASDPTEVMPVVPAPDPVSSANDPTAILPVTPAPTEAEQTVGDAPFAPPPADEYLLPEEQPWHKQPGVLTAIAVGVIAVLGIGGFLVFSGSDSNDDASLATTDADVSVQLEVSRSTPTGDPVAATLTAQVVAPADRPADYQWTLPAGAQAPQPAVATTDADGRARFAWTPIAAPADDPSWSSTVTVEEVLPPNAVLTGDRFNCQLERNGNPTALAVDAAVDTTPITEERRVIYSFAEFQFVVGDSITCSILSGAQNVETTTTAPETSTTLPETTTTEATTTTVAPTTLAPTTLPPTTLAPTTLPPTTLAPVPVVTAAATTTTTTTEAPKSTVVTVLAGLPDLSTFSNLIDRAGLREQLANQDASFTVVAPNNAAIAALLAGENPPDLNDPAAAREFVLAHVKTGAILLGSDLAAQPTVTFDAGPERTVDAAVSPITIGGAQVVQADAIADLGVVHTLDRTLVTPAP